MFLQLPDGSQFDFMDAPLFPEDDADRTLVTLLRDGKPAGEAILGATSKPVSLGESGSSALRRFVPVGVEHIFFGTDHIAFLLALLLPGGRWRSLLGVITASMRLAAIVATMLGLVFSVCTSTLDMGNPYLSAMRPTQ